MDLARSPRFNLDIGGLPAFEGSYTGRSISRRWSPSDEVVATRRIIRRASRSLERHHAYRRSSSKSRSPSPNAVNPKRTTQERSRPVDHHRASGRPFPWYRSASTDAIAVTTIRRYSLSPDRYHPPYHPIRRSVSRGRSPSTDDVGVRAVSQASRPPARRHHRHRSRSRSSSFEAITKEMAQISSHSQHRRHHHHRRYSSRHRSPEINVTRIKRVTRTVSVSPQRPVWRLGRRRSSPHQITVVKKISRTEPAFPHHNHRHSRIKSRSTSPEFVRVKRVIRKTSLSPHRHSRIKSRSPSPEFVRVERVIRKTSLSPHRHTLPILRRRSRSREFTKVERIGRRSSRSPYRPHHRFNPTRDSSTASSSS